MRAVVSGRLACLLAGALAATWTSAGAQTAQGPRVVIGDNAAAESATELAKQIQNPVGDLINLPLQYNVNFGYGPNRGTQHVLNLQPVIPFHLNDDWNLITRTILPIVWNPGSSIPNRASRNCSGLFHCVPLSQSRYRRVALGRRPGRAVSHDQQRHSRLERLGRWSERGSGLLGRPVGRRRRWSIMFCRSAERVGLQAIVTAAFSPTLSLPTTLDEGWYLSSAPNITANWQLSGTKWTVPIGGGGGRDLFRRRAPGRSVSQRLLQRSKADIRRPLAAKHATHVRVLMDPKSKETNA